MVFPYCLDEKSETPQGAWVLSFLYLNSMTAALQKIPNDSRPNELS